MERHVYRKALLSRNMAAIAVHEPAHAFGDRRIRPDADSLLECGDIGAGLQDVGDIPLVCVA